MITQKILQEVFGYQQFRPLQNQAIESVMNGQDCMVILPTGGGKSLCYQIPALAKEGTAIVVSPLISLMKDQVDALRGYGVSAAYLNSSLGIEESRMVMDLLMTGQLKLLYVAPERLVSTGLMDLLQQLPISLIAIDEAHCVSEWGHDFRPEYRQLALLGERLPNVPRIALTASATPQVEQDIQRSLALRAPLLVKGSFDRTNLFYEVRMKQDAMSEILSYVRSANRGSGVIYCGSRKRTEEVAASLVQHGITALAYHAGMTSAQREKHQSLFIRDEVPIMVATVAFGMGIDKPNIRFVIHYDLPKTLENYYQETGRAGRDGLPSDCLLFFSYGDRPMLLSFIERLEDPEEKKRQRHKLQKMIDFASRHQCRRRTLLAYFGERYEARNCKGCDACAGDRKKRDLTELAQKIICAVIRLQQKVGVNLVVDTLRGMANQKVLQQRAHKLSVYGIAKELPANYLKEALQQLVAEGYLAIEGDPYPLVVVTQSGLDAVHTRAPILLALPEPRATRKERETQKDLAYNDALFDQLRAIRKELADRDGLPPYTIFADRSLQEMAYYLPQDEESFRKISGVGDHKLAKFGQQFLREVVQFTLDHQLSPREIPRKPPPPVRKVSQSRLNQVKGLVDEGRSIADMCASLGIKESTLGGYLSEVLEQGNVSRPNLYVDLTVAEKIKELVSDNPEVLLRELKDAIDPENAIPFEKLRLARAYCRSTQKEGHVANPILGS